VGQASLWRAETEEIADLLTGLTDACKNWGFGLRFLHLRNIKGHPSNHKRIYPTGWQAIA
jgi:putative transposase